MSDAGSSPVVRILDVAVLLGIVSLLLVWPVHSPPISTHGEAREGLVVHDIVRNDHWILARRNGELPSKPPLFHWISALAAGDTMPSDAGVRLPSALAALLMVLATFAMGAQTGPRVGAWLGVGALLGMYHVWSTAGQARVDMLFAACVTASLVAFFRWYRTGSSTARACCYLAAAAAVLVKGPVGAVLPAAVILVFLARERWRGERTPRASVAALWSTPLAAIVVAIDVGWYGLAAVQGGREFLDLHLVRENADRFLGKGVFGMHGGRSRLSMLRALATDVLPWNLVLPWAAIRWWRGAREDDAGRFLHTWWIVVVAFFTVAYGKRDVYLLPLYPAVALLVGRAFAAVLERADRDSAFGPVPVPHAIERRFPIRPALATVALVVIVFDLVLIVVSQVVREHRGRRRSLVGFANEVATLVPRGAALYAAPEVQPSDVIVLAYRLRRPLSRGTIVGRDAACAGDAEPPEREMDTTSRRDPHGDAGVVRDVFVLVPAPAAERTDGATVLLRSDRREHDVALLRVDAGRACAVPDAASSTPPATDPAAIDAD